LFGIWEAEIRSTDRVCAGNVRSFSQWKFTPSAPLSTSASAYDLAIANRLHCHFAVATHTSPMKVLPEHMLRLVAPEDRAKLGRAGMPRRKRLTNSPWTLNASCKTSSLFIHPFVTSGRFRIALQHCGQFISLCHCRVENKIGTIQFLKYWEIIADNLSKGGWSWGCVAAVDQGGRTIWIADAHRDKGKRLCVRMKS
jgi:hypothetical protein